MSELINLAPDTLVNPFFFTQDSPSPCVSFLLILLNAIPPSPSTHILPDIVINGGQGTIIQTRKEYSAELVREAHATEF